jgi:AraC-like DNA-binding protein
LELFRLKLLLKFEVNNFSKKTMRLFLKYDINLLCKKIIQEQLNKLSISFTYIGYGEIEINETQSSEKLNKLYSNFNGYGIEIVETQKSILVQKIKVVISEMVYNDDKLPQSKISIYLSEKLNHSYGYISNIFSEVTYSSIEKFIILQKIERAKQMIANNELTFTEIAWKLNYSSVAHFSNQFKNTTGITPSAFQRIVNKRRQITKE